MSSRLFYEHTTASLASRYDFDADAYWEGTLDQNAARSPSVPRARSPSRPRTPAGYSPAEDRSVTSMRSADSFQRRKNKSTQQFDEKSGSSSPLRQRSVSPRKSSGRLASPSRRSLASPSKDKSSAEKRTVRPASTPRTRSATSSRQLTTEGTPPIRDYSKSKSSSLQNKSSASSPRRGMTPPVKPRSATPSQTSRPPISSRTPPPKPRSASTPRTARSTTQRSTTPSSTRRSQSSVKSRKSTTPPLPTKKKPATPTKAQDLSDPDLDDILGTPEKAQSTSDAGAAIALAGAVTAPLVIDAAIADSPPTPVAVDDSLDDILGKVEELPIQEAIDEAPVVESTAKMEEKAVPITPDQKEPVVESQAEKVPETTDDEDNKKTAAALTTAAAVGAATAAAVSASDDKPSRPVVEQTASAEEKGKNHMEVATPVDEEKTGVVNDTVQPIESAMTDDSKMISEVNPDSTMVIPLSETLSTESDVVEKETIDSQPPTTVGSNPDASEKPEQHPDSAADNASLSQKKSVAIIAPSSSSVQSEEESAVADGAASTASNATSDSKSKSGRKRGSGLLQSILKTEKSAAKGTQKKKGSKKSARPMLISCKYNPSRGFTDFQVRKHKKVWHALLEYEKSRMDAKSLATIIIEELFERDFWPGKHWDIDSARVWETAGSEEPTFNAEKIATWDWKDIYSEASATAVIRFLPDRILIENYAYYVAG